MSERRITTSVMGFQQAEAVKLGLSLEQLLVLDWFKTFHGKGLMKSKIFDGREFYWVHYPAVAGALPILRGASEKHISRLVGGLVEAGVLEKRVERGRPGSRVYVAWGPRARDLDTKVVEAPAPPKMTGQDSPVKGDDRTGQSAPDRTGLSGPDRTGQSGGTVSQYSFVNDFTYISPCRTPDVEEPEAVVEALLSEKAILRRLGNGNNGPALRRVLKKELIERGEEQVRRVLSGLAAEMAAGGVRRPMAYLMTILEREQKARA